MESIVLVKVLSLIGAIILLSYLAISLVKKGLLPSKIGQKYLIRVIEYQRLDNKCSLSLVKAGDQHFFIVANQNCISIKSIKIGNNQYHIDD